MTRRPSKSWVDEVARTTHPDQVVWCDGSEAENDRLIDQMVSDGTLLRLNDRHCRTASCTAPTRRTSRAPST